MAQRLPLEDIRVVEFCHVVMGPTCGLVLADLGAEVVKVEPLDGEHTRELLASLGYAGEEVEGPVTRRIVHAA